MDVFEKIEALKELPSQKFVVFYWIKPTTPRLVSESELLRKMSKKYKEVSGFKATVGDLLLLTPKTYKNETLLPSWLGEYILVFSNSKKEFDKAIEYIEKRFYPYDIEYFIKVNQPLDEGFNFLNYEKSSELLDLFLKNNMPEEAIEIARWMDKAASAQSYNFYELRTYCYRTSLNGFFDDYFSFEEVVRRKLDSMDQESNQKDLL